MRLRLLCFLAATLPLPAHVGSPDVFLTGNAGPYQLLVTIRPPEVVPGVAEIEIRSQSAKVRQVHIVPLRLGGEAQFAPVSDLAQASKEDPQFYTGSVWLMATGSWQVRIDVQGEEGAGTLSVPVPALATRVLGMQKTVGFVLLPLGLLLCIGAVSIAGAAAREAQLEAGLEPDKARVRRARMVMAGAVIFVAGALWFGNQWWSSEDGIYRGHVFKPLQLAAQVEGSRLSLRLNDPGWLNRRTDDLLPDHGHLMHLYVIRVPAMDLVWHLHPEPAEGDTFLQQLPVMPAGRYALFGDVVHAGGLPETATGELSVPAVPGQPLQGDDAAGASQPVSDANYDRTVSPLANDYRMVWERGPAPLRARQPYVFRFKVEDAQGKPAQGMDLYMGMLGHAAFVRTDLSVFAHVHPSGSVPMPALALADNGKAASPAGEGMMPMDMPMGTSMQMQTAALPAEVGFPYGFPKPGAYRIYVQVKRGGQIETGVFDAKVVN